MKYSPKTQSLLISQDKLNGVYNDLIYALRTIRELAGLPLDKYKQEGPLTPADYAQRAVLSVARTLDIDMGVDWGCELDLREPM